ncbi:MAG: STAS domain-containing protein [Methylobacter sp.]|jgi:ABC-type transporter Mla MlaB component
MAKNEENNLIGYDPLAWMEEEDTDADKTKDQSVTDEIDSDVNLEEQLADAQTEIIDDYPSDLLDNTRESDVSSEIEIEEIIENPASGDAGGSIDAPDDIEESEVSSEIEIEQNSDVAEEASEGLAAESQIDLAPTLTIQHVESLCEQMKASLAAHDQIEINASDVVSIDTSTLQLLVSLKKEAAKLQKEVTIIYPSPRFVESAQLLGLSDILEVRA